METKKNVEKSRLCKIVYFDEESVTDYMTNLQKNIFLVENILETRDK